MSRYIRPDVGDNTAIYKGLRFWVVELTGAKAVDGFTGKDCDYIMFDGLYGATTATIDRQPNGKLRGNLMSHVEIWYDYENMDELVKLLPSHYESYSKAIS